jgi:hypothetical protein
MLAKLKPLDLGSGAPQRPPIWRRATASISAAGHHRPVDRPEFDLGLIAAVSSFGADSAVLLHMIAGRPPCR